MFWGFFRFTVTTLFTKQLALYCTSTSCSQYKILSLSGMFLLLFWTESLFFHPSYPHIRHCLLSHFSHAHGPLRPNDITDPRQK